MIEWLPTVPNPIQEGELLHSLDEAKKKFEVKELIPGKAWLVLNWDARINLSLKEKFYLHFAVLRWVCSEADDSNIYTEVVFYGDGPTGNLRECRHTYFGEDGYLFYPKPDVIAAGFNALKEFYDL